MTKKELIKLCKLKNDYQKKVYGIDANAYKKNQFNTFEELDYPELNLQNRFIPKNGRDYSDITRQCDIEWTNFLLYQVLKKLDRLIKKIK